MKAIITIIILSINLTAMSQSHYLGLKGGVNWCDQSGDLFKNTEFIRRFSYGFDYGFRWKNNLKIGGNMMYLQSGFKDPLIFTDDFGNPLEIDPFYTEYQFDYLSIPLKVGYEHGNKVFVYGNVGLATSFLLKAKTSTPAFNDNLEEVRRTEFDVTNEVNPVEIGGIIELGFGYTFFENLSVHIEGNFQHGFTTLSSNEYFNGKTILSYRTSVHIGLRYKLKNDNRE